MLLCFRIDFVYGSQVALTEIYFFLIFPLENTLYTLAPRKFISAPADMAQAMF